MYDGPELQARNRWIGLQGLLLSASGKNLGVKRKPWDQTTKPESNLQRRSDQEFYGTRTLQSCRCQAGLR